MKKPQIFLHIICFCFLFLTACFTTTTKIPNDTHNIDIPTPTPTFEQFATTIFLEEICTDTISLHYSLSNIENYGISSYPITLGSVSDAVSFDETALSFYEQLITYDLSTLSDEEKLTYQVLERHLDLMIQADFCSYLSELLGPTTGYQAQLPILLAEYRFDSKQDVENYLNLLPCVYDYFKEIFECEWDGIYGNKKPGYIFTHGISSVVAIKETVSCRVNCKTHSNNT